MKTVVKNDGNDPLVNQVAGTAFVDREQAEDRRKEIVKRKDVWGAILNEIVLEPAVEDKEISGFVAECPKCGEYYFEETSAVYRLCCGNTMHYSVPATLVLHQGRRNIFPYLSSFFSAIVQLADAPIEAITYWCPHCQARIGKEEIQHWYMDKVGKCPKCGEYVRR